VLGLGTHGSAVFAIERDVKNARTEFVIQLTLQREAFAHPRLDTAVMVANRQETGLRLGAKKYVARMCHENYSKWATPACSSCSSFSVLLMQAWLNSSIGRPSTTLYSPFSVVTGKP